ncbi:Isopentenyl-diphosphate Delta-isomerase [Pseudomonas synxantha]|uniref:Isopentenyl-diphosphate Delta-isomerase n=1 Tax=Pseudomonas synxantha TaxID=47883 RepID=A0A3G7U0U7_9PSED|nr:farnesyl diphosphate synthase [Pseudomonas synxantha]AZE52994.1 Isopentenyl-diphosphate Delta-isomerase [Pseudomonas synxantha]
MEETLILVNENDCQTGSAEKLYIHQQGLLHRAFSIFIFDQQGRLLLQQRALGKYHSQGLWTNTCCGHPRCGEDTAAAAKRRLYEEMGLECELQSVFQLLYHEQVSNQLIEHEYDHVFAGICQQDPIANPEEAHAWQWLSLTQVSRCISQAPQTFSIWFRRIFEHHDVAGLRSWQAQARNALFDSWRHDAVERTERMLEQQLPTSEISPSPLHQAMRYAVLGGGKRMRPLLCQAAGFAAGANPVALDMVGAALEMMHIYSLVHDDLPAMDDDELRHGRATVHVQFDQATAILVGDALQSQAFITLCRVPITAERQALLMGELAMAVGSLGMAGGQMIDMDSVGQELDIAQLEQMHRMKTGALIRAAVRMGVLCAEDASFDLDLLDGYCAAIGLAYQVVDDILDATIDTATLGKTAGKDAQDHKPNYVSILGLEQSRKLAQQLGTQAYEALQALPGRTDRLHGLVDLVINRLH